MKQLPLGTQSFEILRNNDCIYVDHAKKKTNTLLNEALTQIHERRYYNRYLGKVILLGIAFFGKKLGCRMETLKLIQ
jgi:hypothetical protein